MRPLVLNDEHAIVVLMPHLSLLISLLLLLGLDVEDLALDLVE